MPLYPSPDKARMGPWLAHVVRRANGLFQFECYHTVRMSLQIDMVALLTTDAIRWQPKVSRISCHTVSALEVEMG